MDVSFNNAVAHWCKPSARAPDTVDVDEIQWVTNKQRRENRKGAKGGSENRST